MRFWLITAIAFAVGLPLPSVAQVSEEQMCVWACLRNAGNGDASSPAYEACVLQNCPGFSAEAPPGPPLDFPPSNRWQVVPNPDGGVRAEIGSAGRTGSLALVCTIGRSTELRLSGDDMFDTANRALQVDGERFELSLSMADDGSATVLQLTVPVIAALEAGQEALLMWGSAPIANFQLAGSSAAIAAVREACR